MNHKQHIEVAYSKQSKQARNEYRFFLTVAVDCFRFILHQGLAFCDHDESEDSKNQGNFLELLQFLVEHNEIINNVVLINARKNLKVIAPDIQKDIVHVIASETTCRIINDLGDDLFSILVAESPDVSVKEQISVLLRYKDKKGCITERFLGIVHVTNTIALSLKAGIESLFPKYGLSMLRLRGQGYDGTSNMRGEFNGLKSLIIKEYESTFCVHCFAHQLQLTIVAVAINHNQIKLLFNIVANLLNVVGASYKQRDILREKQANKIIQELNNESYQVGVVCIKKLSSIQRAGDTRWGSHYGTFINVIGWFSLVINMLNIIVEDDTISKQRGEACALLDSVQSFNFVFNLHLMKGILGITNELSQALQRKDQDIVIL